MTTATATCYVSDNPLANTIWQAWHLLQTFKDDNTMRLLWNDDERAWINSSLIALARAASRVEAGLSDKGELAELFETCPQSLHSYGAVLYMLDAEINGHPLDCECVFGNACMKCEAEEVIA